MIVNRTGVETMIRFLQHTVSHESLQLKMSVFKLRLTLILAFNNH